MNRILFDIILFLSVFIMPWWVAAILALVGIFIYKQFCEFLVVAIIIYALYATRGSRIISSRLWFPLIVSIIFISIQFIRRYIILYKNEI